MNQKEFEKMVLPTLVIETTFKVSGDCCTREHKVNVRFKLEGYTGKDIMNKALRDLKITDFQTLRHRKDADSYLDTLVNKAKATGGYIEWTVTPKGAVEKGAGKSEQVLREALLAAGLAPEYLDEAVKHPKRLVALLQASQGEDEDEGETEE